jgi:4-amino-4-deoxy-L-arabinose transferase-like glycosyltransferase
VWHTKPPLMSAPLEPSDRRYALAVRLLFGSALLLRLGYVLIAHPPGQFVYSDMQSYDSVAFELLAGQPNPWHAFRPVGYSMFLALVYRLTDGSRTFVGVLQALMSAALVPWTAAIARAVGATRVVALLVGLFVALSVPLIFYSGVLLTEVPTAFFLVFALKLALAPEPRRGGFWRHVRIGLALGVAGAMRPNLLHVAPVVAAFVGLVRVRLRDLRAGALALLTVMAALSLPVAVVSAYNSRALGRPAGPAANGGLNFYLNFADVRSVHYSGAFGAYWISPVPNGLRFTRDEPTNVPFFEDTHYYRAGVRFVRQHPDALVRALDNFVEAAGLGRQLYWPNWPGFERTFHRYALWFFALAIAPALAFLLGLGLQALRGRASLPRLLLASVCVMGTLPMYFFLGDPRVRVPFDPIWLVLGGLGFQSIVCVLWARLRRLRSPR